MHSTICRTKARTFVRTHVRAYAARCFNDTYPLGFRTRLPRKDLGIALDTARTFEVPVPVASLDATIEAGLIAQGLGAEAMSNLARFIRRGAGVPDGPLSAGDS